VVSDFIRNGAHLFDRVPRRPAVHRRQSEARNLLERFDDRLGFVEQASHLVEAITTLLGTDYRILDKKVVCGVPARSVPPWLKARILGNLVNNLGARRCSCSRAAIAWAERSSRTS
jgi:phospholipid N-methyltransferase